MWPQQHARLAEPDTSLVNVCEQTFISTAVVEDLFSSRWINAPGQAVCDCQKSSLPCVTLIADYVVVWMGAFACMWTDQCLLYWFPLTLALLGPAFSILHNSHFSWVRRVWLFRCKNKKRGVKAQVWVKPTDLSVRYKTIMYSVQCVLGILPASSSVLTNWYKACVWKSCREVGPGSSVQHMFRSWR